MEIIGLTYDKIIYRDGREEWTPVDHNIVVNGGFVALAQLLAKDASSLFTGDLYHAFGIGDGAWVDPSSPAVSVSALYSESFRKQPYNAEQITSGTGVFAVGGFYNAMKIMTLLDFDECNVTIREHGLFVNATVTSGSGLMYNLVYHNAIVKTTAIQLVRYLEIYVKK